MLVATHPRRRLVEAQVVLEIGCDHEIRKYLKAYYRALPTDQRQECGDRQGETSNQVRFRLRYANPRKFRRCAITSWKMAKKTLGTEALRER